MTSAVQECTYFTGTTDPADQANWMHLIERHVPDLGEKEVLDVGCASGFLMRELEKVCKSVVGVDIREECRVILADCRALPFRDGSFDLVISLGVLEHVDGYEKGISEMRRVMREGGYLFLMTGPTPHWKYFDHPEHRARIPVHPDIGTVKWLLSGGTISKVWAENVRYRLFGMPSFRLFPTNPALAKVFESDFMRGALVAVLRFLERHDQEQNICLFFREAAV